MKYLLLILMAVSAAATAHEHVFCGGEGITYGCYLKMPPGGGEILLPSLPGIVVGDIFTKPQPKKRVAHEQPSAQYLEILAQANARAKETTKQWWINLFAK